MERDTSRSILQCSKYCSRKIHRIRVTLGITQVTTKRKQKREKEKEPKVCANAAERTLMLPLFLAERAWSYAMQLKEVLCCLKKPPHRSESFRADSAPCSNTCPCACLYALLECRKRAMTTRASSSICFVVSPRPPSGVASSKSFVLRLAPTIEPCSRQRYCNARPYGYGYGLDWMITITHSRALTV